MHTKFQILLFVAILLASSCKKNYHCECTKTSVSGQSLDSWQQNIRSKNNKQAYHDCLNDYLSANPAPGSAGEISCNID